MIKKNSVRIVVVNWRQHGDDESSLFTHVAGPMSKSDSCGLIERALGYPKEHEICSGDFAAVGMYEHVYYTDETIPISDGDVIQDDAGSYYRVRFELLEKKTVFALRTDVLGELAEPVSRELADGIVERVNEQREA